MSKHNFDYVDAAKAMGRTTECTRCKKPMIYCGKQPAPAEHAVCTTCVKSEAQVVP